MLVDYVEQNNLEGAKLALSMGQVQWTDAFGYSALHIALSKGYDAIAECLITGGMDVNLQDPKGQTGLHYCALHNKPQLAKQILQHGGNLDAADQFGNPPLWTALMSDKGFGTHAAMVSLLVAYGASPNQENKAGRSPMALARDMEYDAVLAIMESA